MRLRFGAPDGIGSAPNQGDTETTGDRTSTRTRDQVTRRRNHVGLVRLAEPLVAAGDRYNAADGRISQRPHKSDFTTSIPTFLLETWNFGEEILVSAPLPLSWPSALSTSDRSARHLRAFQAGCAGSTPLARSTGNPCQSMGFVAFWGRALDAAAEVGTFDKPESTRRRNSATRVNQTITP